MSHAIPTRHRPNSGSPSQTSCEEDQLPLLQMKKPTKTIPSWRKYLTVEPAVFFYFYGWLMYFLVGGIYMYERVSEMKGFPYENVSRRGGGGKCRGEDLGNNSSLWQLEEEVQKHASTIALGYNLVLVIASLLVAPLWGPWTDKGGKRKPALQAAILGACLEVTVTLLVMYFEWSVYMLFVSAAISGFSGFAPVLMVGATSYIADISTKEERAYRIAILYLAVFLAGVLSQLTSGLWIERLGFIPACWFILSCFIFAGVWTLFCVPEIPKPTNDITVRFFSTENFKSFVNLFRKQRDAGRKNLLLLMICAGIVSLSTAGIEGVKTLYILKSPLCWSPTLVGYFFAFEMFIHGIGSVAGVKYLGSCFKELTIARIGMATLMSSLILLACSDRTWMVFVAGIVGVFLGVSEPILMSGMSRIVGEDEQGALFSAHCVVIALTQLIGAVLFNSVYQATLSLTFQGLVFILAGVLVLIPFALVSFIDLPHIVQDETAEDQDLEKKQQRETNSC